MQASINISDDLAKLRMQAIQYLSYREHSYTELREKLLKKYDCSEQVDGVLQELINEGLLSEKRYVQSYINSRVNKGYGPERIRMELIQKRVSASLIDVELAQCEFDWADEIRKVWSKKFKNKQPVTIQDKARQWRFLQYRGYSPDLIGELIQ